MVSPISNIGTSFFSFLGGGFGFFPNLKGFFLIPKSPKSPTWKAKTVSTFHCPSTAKCLVWPFPWKTGKMLEVSLRNCQDSPEKNTRKQSNWWNLDQVFLELRNNQPSKFVNDRFCLGLWNKHLRSFAKQNISFSKSFSQCLLLLRDLRADSTLDLGSFPPKFWWVIRCKV